MTQTMKQVMDISESTLYPVLRRLQKENYLRTYDKPYQGRNRRYYAITEIGDQKYETYKHDWMIYKTQVDSLLCGVAQAQEACAEQMQEACAEQVQEACTKEMNKSEIEEGGEDDE